MKGFLLCVSQLLLFTCGIAAQNPDSLLGVAQKEAVENHYAEANRIMDTLIAQYPVNSNYNVFYGVLCSWMHKYDSSKTILRQVIAIEPNNLSAYDALTNTEIWSGDDSMAIIDCNKALLIPEDDKESYIIKIAEAQKDLKNFPPAFTSLDSLLEINPGDTSAKNMRIVLYSAALQKTADSLYDTAEHLTYRKQYPAAQKIAKKITFEYPANTDYKILWSRTFTYTKKTDTARILLDEVIATDPGNLDAYEAYADNELVASKYKQSIIYANTGIKLPVKGDRADLVITKASAQDGLGHYAGALKTLDTLVKKHPDNKEAEDLYKLILGHIRQKTADSIYAAAQQDAAKKDYIDAETKMDTITAWYPDNTDYMIYKGRVDCWEDIYANLAGYQFRFLGIPGQFYSVQNKYDTGIAILNGVIKKHPHNLDAYDALTDAELLKKHFSLVVADCDRALQDSVFAGYPTMRVIKKDTTPADTDVVASALRDTAKKNILKAVKKDTNTVKKDTNTLRYYTLFMLKRAQALSDMEDYKGCANTLDTLHKIDSTNKDANNLLTETKIKLLKNTLQFGFLTNLFNAAPFGPWYYYWIQYMYNFYHCPVAVKATYGSIYGSPIGYRDGWQYQVEAYPKISSTSYADASIAYSNSYSVFPQWQLAADIYQKLPGNFEISLGGMYMHFIDVIDEPPTPPQDIWIFDPYIGYYVGDKYQFSYKPYIAFKGTSVYVTHTVTLRRFLGNPDSWVSLYGAIGSSPFVDYYFPSPQPTSVRLIGVDYQTRLPHNWLIWPMVGYEYEEYYPPNHLWGNMFYAQMIITKRF